MDDVVLETLDRKHLEAIDLGSSEAESFGLHLDQDPSPGEFTLNGPASELTGAIALGPIDLQLAYQSLVDLLHDDEDEVEWVCENNREEVEQCRAFQDECAPACRADEEGEIEGCLEACADTMRPEMRAALLDHQRCLAAVPEEECARDDLGCRNASCAESEASTHEYCHERERCEEQRRPAPPAPEVRGLVELQVPGINGVLGYTGAEDTLTLSDAGLGAETLGLLLNDEPLLAVDLNAEVGRVMGLTMNSESENLRLQFAGPIALQAAFSMYLTDGAIELPDFMQDETISVDLDGAEQPTIELVGGDDDRELRVSAGELRLGSTAMEEVVVITEGMCIGSMEEEEEDESSHDLFGGLQEVMCGG